MIEILHRYRIQAGIFGVLVCLLGAFMVLSPRTFLSPRIYVSFGSTIPFVAILALGLTFLIIAGELDLSFPSVMAVSGLTFAEIFTGTGNAFMAFMAAIAVGGLAGWINGLLVVTVGVPSIIATIGTQFFWRGLSALMADGLARNIVPVRETLVHHAFVGRIGGLIGAVIIGIIEAGIICAGLSGFWTRLVHGFIIVASVSAYATVLKTGR